MAKNLKPEYKQAAEVLIRTGDLEQAAEAAGTKPKSLQRAMQRNPYFQSHIDRRFTKAQMETDRIIASRAHDIDSLFEACKREIIHPDDPNEFTLANHISEIEVLVETVDDSGKVQREFRNLADLCSQIESALGIKIVKSKSRFTDPRKLMLEAAEKLLKFADMWAKLKGQYVAPKTNPEDLQDRELLLRRIIRDLVEAKGLDEDTACAEAHEIVLLQERLLTP